MYKPYTENLDPGHTALRVGSYLDGGIYDWPRLGAYVPGGSYGTTMTWNRAASTVQITITGPGGPFASTVPSAGAPITGLRLQGPSWNGMGASQLGNVQVFTAPIPEPGTWALMLGGLAAVLGLRRRRCRR